VRYSPVANGVSSDQIIVNYNNGNAVVPATRDIQGVAADPALLTISNSPNFDYGNRVLSTNTDQTFTLTNSGGVTATTMADDFGLAAPFNWKGGTYPGTGGTCTGVATVAPLASCTIVVTYTPTVVGPHSDTISVRYNNGLATVTTQRDVLGTGVSIATLTISDSDPYGFGTVAATTTNYKTFTITNTGSGAASSMADGLGLAAPFSFKDGTYPGNGGSCNTALASLATCTIIVAYNPAANGSHSDGLIVSYFNGVSSQNLTKTLNGTAAAAANVAVSDGPGTYNYGNVSTSSSADHTFTLTNNGGVIATTMGDGFGLAVPFNWKTSGNYPGTGTCGLTLAPTSSCTVIVTFSPAIAAVSSDTLVVNYHNGLIATNTTRDVTGTGVNAAVLTISNGATYNFGGRVIGTNTDFTFTVSRTGSLNATGLNGTGLAAPFTFKGGSYPGSGGTCDTDLTVGEGTCTIVVTYSPTASGVQSDQIVLNYNDGVTTQQALRDVTGTGQIPASVSISDAATYDYGSRAIGSNTDHTFTLTRTGDVDATGMADGLGLAAPYNWKDGTYPGTGGNCGPTLTVASSTCTIVVTFSPTGSGTFNDAILVNYNNGVSGQQASRAVTGAASVSPAVLTISNSATYDYGSKVIGSNTDFTFTVSRTGSATATSLSGAGLAAPFTFKGGSYPGSGGSCDSDLTVGEGTCTIVVTYSPTASGAHSDQIVLNYNDGAAAQQAVRDVTGTGQIPATVTISDASTYDYGSKTIGSNTDKTFTLTRTGDVDATGLADGLGLAAPYNWKGGSYPGTPGGTCNNSLTVASSTCTIVVTYSPVAGGTFNDAIIMNYNDGVAAQQAVRAVTGSASTAAVITVSDGPTYNYGTNTYNTAIHKTFTLTNSGGVDATSVGDGFGLAAPYTWKTSGTYPGAGGTCGATLTAGNSCTVFVTYTPTTGGIHNDTLDVSYNDGSATQHATRDVTGLVVASSYCANKLANSPFAGGTGTAPDPYTICTPAQFLNIPTQLSANFSQRDNLNFSGVTFTPVGTNAAPLTGSYDGKNFDISNVLYNNNTVDYVGLFGGSSGVLKNIKMLNANITGRDYVGGIVGRMNGGSLSYSSVSGTGITGQDFVGGVVGQASSGSITKSWSNLNVTGIAGSDGVGGFVGSSAIAITESYTKTATVSGVNKIGGFAGEVTANTISDSYAAETVSGTTKVGGFTGESSGGSFARVHSVGSVSGTTNVGGLMGSKSGGGSETNSYWNTTTSTRGTSAGSESGLTSANMALLSNFTNFNFNSVWRLDSAYPQLSFASYNTLTNPLSYYRLESFEGTGTVETWGAGGVTAPNSVDDDSTAYITSNTPGIWGSQSFRVTTSNSAVDDLAYKTLAFTGRNHSWTSFDVAFSTLPTPVTASISVFKTLDSGASATAVAVDLINDGGANRLAFNVYHNGSANQYTWPSSGSIQTGQIYRVNMLWDTNYDVWQIRVNGQTVLTGNLTGSAASLAVGYFIAGSDLGNSPMTLVYDLDNIRISEAPSEAITQTSETTITLSTSGTPDSCQLTNLTNATITSPCSCTSGVCSVKLKGTSSGTGRFDYTATSNGQVSPPASVDLSIP
ncbi:MAG: choice-of-anchor D domain-containing protein, partial [Bdellovibrionia bacterium]